MNTTDSPSLITFKRVCEHGSLQDVVTMYALHKAYLEEEVRIKCGSHSWDMLTVNTTRLQIGCCVAVQACNYEIVEWMYSVDPTVLNVTRELHNVPHLYTFETNCLYTFETHCRGTINSWWGNGNNVSTIDDRIKMLNVLFKIAQASNQPLYKCFKSASVSNELQIFKWFYSTISPNLERRIDFYGLFVSCVNFDWWGHAEFLYSMGEIQVCRLNQELIDEKCIRLDDRSTSQIRAFINDCKYRSPYERLFR